MEPFRIHQTKSLISGRNTLSPQDMAPMYILARDIDDRKDYCCHEIAPDQEPTILYRADTVTECNKKVDLKGGMYVCGSAHSYFGIVRHLDLIGGITAEELKGYAAKEGFGLEKRNLAFPVMQIKDDIAVVNEYCPGMLKEAKQKSTNSEEPLDDEFDSDEAESPLPNPLSQVAKGCSNDSEAVKRRLLDEFSSTQVSKKKTHLVQIKVEKR
nr:putative transposase [Ipomoea batatas]